MILSDHISFRLSGLLVLKVVFVLLFFSENIYAQDCSLSLTGKIMDKGTAIPLEFSNVFIEDLGRGAVTDKDGFFEIKNICPADYHLAVSHLGCETVEIFLVIKKDTFINLYLSHHEELLDEVVVHGSKAENTTAVSSTINRATITTESNENIADILESIVGVSVLRNGSGISKPVVHGLFGNRVTILNNGIAQSGQQWGNDHAPEIDPFVADHLSVVKGVSTLAYGGNSLGSLVMVESAPITNDPHLHGETNYTFETNGLGHTINARLEKKNDWAAWRVSGSLKRKGDTHTPDYFLTNTGQRENNIAFQLDKKWNSRWDTEFYYSLFNTEIGVLRGSHIGNLTDLNQAIGQKIPFFTEDNFAYNINPPRQLVNHHLVKVSIKHSLSDHQILKFNYGGQLNQRKEFDIRRGDRSDIPALNLNQFSNFFEVAYDGDFSEHFFLKTGIQFTYVDNGNQSGTGILPLIPNYDAAKTGAYFILKNNNPSKWFYEFGGRYDFKYLSIFTIDNRISRNIIRPTHHFHNYTISGGVKYQPSHDFKSSFNLGYLLRAPEVNELYSAGLHQGVSGIEEGDPNLNSERSLKATLSFDGVVKEKLFFQVLGYFQHVQDFIYLQPQEEFRLTIRGAFPLFIYKQANVNIYGTDVLLKYAPRQNWSLTAKYAIVRGDNLTDDVALINIPSDNISTSFSYIFSDENFLKNTSLSLSGSYFFRQGRITDEQDFLSPPDGYGLIGFQAARDFPLGKNKLKISLKADNLLNTAYRDYLNRLRYFADEPGRNIKLNIRYVF